MWLGFLVCLWGFFGSKWGIRCQWSGCHSYKNKMGENSYEPPLWDFLLPRSHQTYTPYAADLRLCTREIQRYPTQHQYWQISAFSIIFSIQLVWKGKGKGRGSLMKNTVYLLWTVWLLQRQFNEAHLSHPKFKTHTNCTVEGFMVKTTVLQTTESSGNKQQVFLLQVGLQAQ